MHRDVKPSNILLGPDDEPFLIDFGLAGRVGRRSGDSGYVGGTRRYSAPEQADADRTLTPAVDVYGLGATLYHLLTGKPPQFEPTQAADRSQESPGEHLIPPRRLNRKAPIDLERVCLKCLEAAPEDRYPSAALVRDDLSRFLAGTMVSANPVGAWGRLARWARHKPGLAALAASLLLAVSFVFAMIATLYIREKANRFAESQLRGRAVELASVAQSALDLTVGTVITDDKRFIFDLPLSVRADVAQQVIPYYDRLIALNGDDATARGRVASILLERVRLRHAVGSRDDDALALADCRQAIDLFTKAGAGVDNEFGRARALLMIGGNFWAPWRVSDGDGVPRSGPAHPVEAGRARSAQYRVSLRSGQVLEQRGKLPPVPG